MAKNKTNATVKSVDDFIAAIESEQKRDDSYALIEIFKAATGFDAVMWGTSIIGFGSYHYKYDSGREGDMAIASFSPRKGAISLYLSGEPDEREKLLKKFGKHKADKGCIHISKLEDIDPSVLKKLIIGSVKKIKKLYPSKK